MAQPQQNQKRSMHQPVPDYVYTINRFHEGDEWMLVSVDAIITSKCVWTKIIGKAHLFLSEQEAHDIIDLVQGPLDKTHIGRIAVGA